MALLLGSSDARSRTSRTSVAVADPSFQVSTLPLDSPAVWAEEDLALHDTPWAVHDKMERAVTLLPQPLSPTTHRVSPRRTLRSTPSTAFTTPSSRKKWVLSPLTSSSVSVHALIWHRGLPSLSGRRP